MLDQDGLKVTAMVSVLRPSGLKYSHRLLLPGKSRLGLATEWIEITTAGDYSLVDIVSVLRPSGLK